jgi:hypothetical protein
MNKSVISLLSSNFILLLNVVFFNTNILTVILIYACELVAVIVLQISKVLYLKFTGKQTILNSLSCVSIFVFGIIIFIFSQGIGTVFFILNYLFQILNYKVEINVLITFIVIFTLSHLVSFKLNFINKLSQENITPKTSDQQDNHKEAAIINFAKIMNRIGTLGAVSIFSIFFVALSIWFGLSNYINYYVGIIFCLIKTYYDYNSHIMEHNFNEKFGIKTNLE